MWTGAGLLGILGCLAAIGAALAGTGGLESSADVAQLVSVLLAVPALAASLMLWWRQAAGPAVITPAALTAATDVLAGLVGQQWRTEATIRSLDDPDPIPVRWRPARDTRLADHPVNLSPTTVPTAVSSADVAGLAAAFRAMRRRRLVLLGGPGSGKTTLAVQLLRELLATRRDHPDEPVPVLLSVAGWDTGTCPRLQDWLAARLAQDYPALRATVLGPDAPAVLAARGLILPVLDGLDELPPVSRAAVVIALNRSLGDTDQVVVTSRTVDYRHAVNAAGDVLTSAVVLEPEPLDPAAGAGYLRRCLPPVPGRAWERILAGLHHGALAEVTATALGLWLLRSVYLSPVADPAELLDQGRFPDGTALRTHLFDRLIPALVEARPPSADPADPFRPRRRHDPARMRDRLGFLARHLCDPRGEDGGPRTRDLLWWDLARTTRAFSPAVRAALAAVVAVTIAAVSTVANVMSEGMPRGLTHGFGYGLAFGLVSGGIVAAGARSWPRQPPGFADLWRHGRRSVPRSRLRVLFRRGAVIGLGAALLSGTVIGMVDGARAGTAAGPVTGLAIGIAYVVTAWFTAWAESPTRDGHADTPQAVWRADRNLNLLRAGVTGLTSGLAGGLASGLSAAAVDTVAFGVSVGVTYALTFGITTGLTAGRHHAWMAYLIATGRLARAGVLPRRLMGFLDDAHRLGLLRAVGPVYQFRHAEFQDHLAAGGSARAR